MSSPRFEVSSLRLVVAVATTFLVVACGGGSSGNNGGGAGKSDAKGGSSGDTGNATGGAGDEPGSGGEGGGQTGGTANSTDTGGSGGTSSAGGTGGSSNTGGTVGTGGVAATGGTTGMVDMSKERVWIDADITFGPNGSITHNQPNNWFSPIDYYNGSMEVRANVTEAPSGTYGLELCLYKSGPGDEKHDCLPLAYLLKGTGEHLVTNKKSSIILRNPLAAAGVSEADFMTPWAANNTRLVGAQHAMPIAGPVKTHLTIVLVPKGYTFSGWSKYPRK